MPPTTQSSATWLSFAMLTVFCWGTYGIFLATGSESMHDAANGRMKAFLFVGIAYFLAAVLAPLLILVLSGANWDYPVKGMALSLIAGIVGAIGALGALLAFGAKGSKRAPSATRPSLRRILIGTNHPAGHESATNMTLSIIAKEREIGIWHSIPGSWYLAADTWQLAKATTNMKYQIPMTSVFCRDSACTERLG